MSMLESLKSFVIKSKRVWMVLRKPSRKEFEMTSKVSAIGILLLGLAGFIISMIVSIFF